MVLDFDLTNARAKVTLALGALIVCALLAFAQVTDFIAGILTDQRAEVSRETLITGLAYAPNSARLHARLARVEMLEADSDLSEIEKHSLAAVRMSPWNFSHRLLLASVQESKGDRTGAEKSTRQALALAPDNAEVHWRLANLLLRQGKLKLALDEFRIASASNRSFLPIVFDMLWQASGGKAGLLEAASPDTPAAGFELARFLFDRSRAEDAARVFAGIDHNARLSPDNSPGFLSALIDKGHFEIARDLWLGIVAQDAQKETPLLWNGSFESDISKNFSQFDWSIKSNEYARSTLDADASRSGTRSLRIDFLGRDTTRLDGEIKQLVAVRPGNRYSLECYFKTEDLITPEGPRVTIEDRSSRKVIAASYPLAFGSSNWQRLSIDFTAPDQTRAVLVTIKRVPRFSYDDPTRGRVWFDDFALVEAGKK